MSDLIQSVSVAIKPGDHRCKYWAKVVSAADLPNPEAVNGANDLPGSYLRQGDNVELFEGDFLFEGEENDHRKSRGWTYTVTFINFRGVKEIWAADATSKTWVKEAVASGNVGKDTAKALLRGAGGISMAVRDAHWLVLSQRPNPEAPGNRIAEHFKALHEILNAL